MIAALEYALEYLAMGYPVLPLLGKQPATNLVPHGKDDANLDRNSIRRWFASSGYNVGIVPPAQALVLDVDDPEALPPLLADHPELEMAPIAVTGSGGNHVWVKLPEGVSLTAKVRVLPGIDLRGMGRTYLVAPPSTHPDTGWAYKWATPLVAPTDLPTIPTALLERLLPQPTPARAATSAAPSTPSQARLLGLLEWACRRVSQASKGQRHATLLSQARLVGGWLHLGLEHDLALERLALAGATAGLPEREAHATARDGLEYGGESPLPLPDSTHPFGSVPPFGSAPSELNLNLSGTDKTHLVHRLPRCHALGELKPPDLKRFERLPWQKGGERG